MGLLADIFSYGDGLKRKVNGLLQDPAGTVGLGATRAAEDQNSLLNLFANAYPMTGNKTVLNTPQQVAQFRGEAADKALETYGGLLGATKFVYPQEKALRTAQRNAAKPVSEGGLGLRSDNTPAERAKAMGFDFPAAHFSRHGADVKTLDSGQYAIAPFDAVGTHVGSPEQVLDRFNKTVGYKVGNPSYANDELKAVTYPLSVRRGRQMLTEEGRPFNETPLSMGFSETADYGNLRESNKALRQKVFAEKDSIPYINDVELPGQISYIVPPQNLRSRFAAFDPARRGDADLLGAARVDLLGLLAGGTAGGLYLNERGKKSK